MNKKSYTVYINSNDKMVGTKNNNATYQINWDDFIDRKYNSYKVNWNLTTSSGFYFDTLDNLMENAKVYIDFGSKSFSFDTGTKSNSNCIGFIHRTNGNVDDVKFSLSANYLRNCPKMINRPTQNFIQVQIINSFDGLLFTNTGSTGIKEEDMTSYNLCLEFIPVEGSEI